ncbi:MAG: hypothetical protein Q7R47_05055 [Candidatus Diapherotrites archaeon]|nr:hypothetical protein [Candidatus Diapherotrites archaeon]
MGRIEMNPEIERKFLVRKMPSLYGLTPVKQERYYLFDGNGIEIRIQSKNDHFELERKTRIGKLSRDSHKIPISKKEFDALKKFGKSKTVRTSYAISKNPNIKIKVYAGKFRGLVRAEIEFESEKTARRFKPMAGMGTEITHTPLGRDQELGKLGRKRFKQLLNRLL